MMRTVYQLSVDKHPILRYERFRVIRLTFSPASHVIRTKDMETLAEFWNRDYAEMFLTLMQTKQAQL